MERATRTMAPSNGRAAGPAAPPLRPVSLPLSAPHCVPPPALSWCASLEPGSQG